MQKLAIACQFDIQPLITEANRLACSQALSAAQTALEQDNLDLYQTAIEDISDILDVLTRNLNNIATYIAERNSLQDQNATIDENFINTAEELITLIESLQPASQTQSPNSEANTFVIQIWRTLFSWSKDDVFNGNLNRIMLALLAGAIGSVISLLMRLNDLEPRQLSAPFLLGLFQPLIGAVTSVVVVAILSTDAVDVINIFPEQLQLRETREAVEPSVTTGTEGTGATAIRATRSNPVGRLDTHEVYKILIIGFFVGFSERLAKDTLGKLNTGRLG